MRPADRPIDAVLLLGFGGPSTPAEVPAFLEAFLDGRPGSRERLEEVRRHYEAIGGSPFLALTRAQAEGLQRELAARGFPVPVRLGFRQWHPFIEDTLAGMADEGLRHAVAIVLAPQRCRLNHARYIRAVEKARHRLGPRAPTIRYLGPWNREPRYVRTLARSIEAASATLAEESRGGAALLFSLHAIPGRLCDRCRTAGRSCSYAEQAWETAGDVARTLGEREFGVAYQSAPSKPGRWTSPAVEESLDEIARDGKEAVVVAPIGFLCDHVEVLHDLDIEAREHAQRRGLEYRRASTPGTDPEFIAMLADRILE